MKKKQFIYNSKVYFLLSIFVCQSLMPTIIYGLSGDASQPEFAAYEEFNTTDMVDLITGDFSYNIPLLNVPSPDGGFQMPLSYHAGIELDEESSWVGLGWSLNPGVVDRTVSMYPDDFKGENVATNVAIDGGSAYIRNFMMYTEYYDSEKGKGGTIALSDLNFGWGTKKHVGLSSVGLTYANGALKYSVDDMAQSMGKHMTNMISIWGGPVGGYISAAYSGIQTAATISSAGNALKSEHNGGWEITPSIEKKGFLGIGKKTAFKWHFDQTTAEDQYGSLYLDAMGRGSVNSGSSSFVHVYNGSLHSPSNSNLMNSYYASSPSTNNTHVPSSDMFMHYNQGAYFNNVNPTGIAYDNFNVKSSGISGSIAPFRQDMGSFSNSAAMNDYHISYNVANFGYPTGGKVNFKYNGDISNSYTYPVIGGNINNPAFAFTSSYSSTDNSVLINDAKAYDNNDVGYNPNVKTEPLRNGLYNNNLVHGKHIQWYTNAEIASANAKLTGFMEAEAFFSRGSLPQSGIGGFTITREDGLTYHYTIPVYNKEEYNRFEQGTTHCRVYNANPYATMWLLTGITGSDFIDRGTIGLIDNNDWGYWVKFSYGKFASNYTWRTPYHSFAVSGTDNFSFKRGAKETYYLNKISTRTHTALFAKSYKSDGKGFHDSDGLDIGDGIGVTTPSSALKLDDIYVLENEDYNILTTSLGLNPTYNSGVGNSGLRNGDTYANVLDNFDLATTGIASFLAANQINKFHFNYSYALCDKTWNSFDFSSTDGSVPVYNSDNGASVNSALRKGKLTLESVDMLSMQNARITPSYVFDYGNLASSAENPNYDINKWDDWNMYSPNGVNATTGHEPSASGDQWSLKKITTPLGSQIEVNYERDSYGSVNGIGVSEKLGGGLRVKTIKVKDENGNAYVTKYTYTRNGQETGVSSGVCTYEPEHVHGTYYSFYDLQDHPVTPILYSNVTVTNGRFEGVFQETNKTSFHFVTPHQNMISYNKNVISDSQYHTNHTTCCFPVYGQNFYEYYNEVSANFNIINKTAQIGNLDTIKSYNSKNHLINKIVYEYSDNSLNDYPFDMGKYCETSFLYEYFRTSHVVNDVNNPTLTADSYLYRLLQTNRVKFPNILKSVTTVQNGITSKQDFKEYDYLTGTPTKIVTTYGNQEKYESQTVPAYTKYLEMGSKVYDPKSKNMMTAPAESYSYVYDQNNTKKLLDASVTTWSRAQNYREYVSGTNSYQNASTSSVYSLPYSQGSIYHPYQSYQWKSLVEEDGTVKNSDFVAYSWSLPSQNAHWVKTSEATLYDRYSKLLESKDINSQKSSVKFGYGNAYPVGDQENSSYTGWCYSGAEDKSEESPNYFSGEVGGLSTQFLSSTFAHTGKYSSRCFANQTGFIYKGGYGTDFNYTTYRASVWVHQSNVQDAVLYASINNSGSAITTVQTKLGDPGVTQVGSWYLFNLDLKINSAITNAVSVEFGCKNTPSSTSTGGAVYFDDFRVHKISTPLTSNVYDYKTGLVTATLDEENFATKFVYDNVGRVVATYKETKQGLKQVSKSEYHYSR